MASQASAIEPCNSCKAAEAAGVLDQTEAYESDRDVPSDLDGDDENLDERINPDFADENEIIKNVWGSASDESDDETINEDDVASTTVKSRSRRAYVKMPTGKKYNIPSPHPRMQRDWSCFSMKASFERITPHNWKTKDEYKIITKEMEKTIVWHNGFNFKKYNIIKIEKVINGCRWKQYRHRQMEIKAEVGYVNQRMLFHGSTSVDIIAKNGFDEQYSNTNGMFGAGIYFAKHSSKANQYVFSTAKAGGCPQHQKLDCKVCERKMLLCRVTLGKTKVAYTYEGHAHAPAECNSVTGVPSKQPKGLKYPEYVIYRREQAYPEYVITYKIE